jgi:hypothetical protein
LAIIAEALCHRIGGSGNADTVIPPFAAVWIKPTEGKGVSRFQVSDDAMCIEA